MAVVVKGKRNNDVVLLTPNEKFNKYKDEMNGNIRLTNDGHFKFDAKTGEISTLTAEQRAFRAGYINAMRDSYKCYYAKNNKKN